MVANGWSGSLLKHLQDQTPGNGTQVVEARLTRRQRAYAWLDLMLIDHGFLRVLYSNRHRVTPRLWRSAQPAPGDLKRFKGLGGKSIVCVRSGSETGLWSLEQEACAKLGLDLHRVRIRGRVAPHKKDLLDLVDLLGSLKYPALVHCKSGADRTGFVTAIYLIVIEGRSIDEGLAQLALRFGHMRSSRAGVLGEVIESFRREGAANGLDFRQWVEHRYDAAAVSARFQPRRFSSVLADVVLRREG